MSTEAIAAAQAVRGLEPRTKLLLLVLAIRSDADDVCADGLSDLTEMTGMSPPSVRRHLGILDEARLVVRDFQGEHSAGVLVDTRGVRALSRKGA